MQAALRHRLRLRPACALKATTNASQGAMNHPAARRFDRLLAPVHWLIWRDRNRRVQKLLRFGETETDGGRDLLRAPRRSRAIR